MPKCDFIKSEFTLRHECSPLNLLHILRTPFPKNNERAAFKKQIRKEQLRRYATFYDIIFGEVEAKIQKL